MGREEEKDMAFETKKIEISSWECASAYAYGSRDSVPLLVCDGDEFFILRQTFSDIALFLRANGEVVLSDDIPSLKIRLEFKEKSASLRLFAEALMTISAYVYMKDRREGLVRIVVCEDGGKENTVFTSVMSASTAERAFDRIMKKVLRRLFAEDEYIASALPSLRGLKFPYRNIREGQDKFVRSAYSALRSGKTLFCEAPTGIGKTMASLFAAVRAAGDGYVDKIFYLTAKGSVSAEAYKACERLISVGANVRVVRIEAKGKLCPMHSYDSFECDMYRCPLMKGYSDRSEDAIHDILASGNAFDSETVYEYARMYNICPYELSLDLSELCLVIICDYNYAFDPRVKIKRYFDDFSKKRKYAFLIDEAHNLPARAKEMYSSSVSVSDMDMLLSEISECEGEGEKNEETERLKIAVEEFRSVLRKSARLCEDNALQDKDGVKHGFYLSTSQYTRLTAAAVKLEAGLSDFKKKNRLSMLYDTVSDFLADLSSYRSGCEYVSDGMRYYISLDGDEIKSKCMCVDPSMQIGDRLRFAVSSIFFSATLSPMEYYMKTLSTERAPRSLVLSSPFPKENLFSGVYTNLSTRFEDREKNVTRIVNLLGAVLRAKKGNYMVYFPSYGYMKTVFERFTQKYPSVHTMIQRSGMSSREKQDFMDFFSDDSDRLRIGFAVLGGMFSEGIDLPGNRLIGTVIIGVGLPGISSEENIVKEYYDFEGLSGFDFAYTFPGMNNVLQAAGRVIRSESDKGVVIFADDRYATEKYRRLMPERFSHAEFYADNGSLFDDLCAFWGKN